MSEDDLRHKSLLCDLLMKEGIQDRPEQDAVDRTLLLTRLAAELERDDCLACALAWFEALEQRGVRDELSIILDASRADAIATHRYGTEWTWEQTTLAQELFYLRRAVSHPHFIRLSETDRCTILNNLASRLRVAGRLVESLEYWRRVLELQPDFGMALCNRALVLATYAEALEDPGQRALFLWVAYKEASVALGPTAFYTHAHDERTREAVRRLKDWIESVMDMQRMAALDPLTWPDASTTEEERAYRDWCLANRLYLNSSNDLGSYTVASTDSLGLPSHVVLVDAPHKLESFFDQMKQEYASARWMLFEGLTARAPHFSDRDVSLHVTEPRAALSLAIERVKASYRLSYSLFDKLGWFLNDYMVLGIPERDVSFRKLWRSGHAKPIRTQFDQRTNWGFCALYWLAKDFIEEGYDEVAEPQARGLSDIRNYLEHKYLRITVDEPPTSPPHDLALMVSRHDFEAKALHLARLARSALIYLAIGVLLEERRREPAHASVPIVQLPSTPDVPDAEKT